MKEIDFNQVEESLYDNIGKSLVILAEEVEELIKSARKEESNPLAKEILQDILKNGQVAKELNRPLCQDTGLAVFFVEIGKDLSSIGEIEATINRAVKRAYHDFYLRKSVVKDPVFDRQNTGDNLPAIIHYSFIDGDKLRISFSAKGGGSENMSRLAMLKPSDGLAGVKRFVIETVKIAGGNPCPPIIVGVGVGGNFETCALLAKQSLSRELSDRHPEEKWARLEDELLKEINLLGVGPQGLGGDTSALAVKIEKGPCHIASLPVAVNIQCHSHRHFTLEF